MNILYNTLKSEPCIVTWIQGHLVYFLGTNSGIMNNTVCVIFCREPHCVCVMFYWEHHCFCDVLLGAVLWNHSLHAMTIFIILLPKLALIHLKTTVNPLLHWHWFCTIVIIASTDPYISLVHESMRSSLLLLCLSLGQGLHWLYFNYLVVDVLFVVFV